MCELEMLEGRLAEARANCASALVVDPLSFQASWLAADLSKIEGDFDRAVNSLDSLRALYPDYIPLEADVAFTRILAGDSLLGRRDLAYWVELLGGDRVLADALWGDTRRVALAQVASELRPSASDLAALAALLGEYDAALDAAETAVESGEPAAVRFPVFPEYAGLRGMPRYDALVERVLSGRRDGRKPGSG